jgi:hypothetical protein
MTPLALVAVAVLASLRCWNRGSCSGATWASLPSQCWYPCEHCPGSVAIVAVTALASLRRWHHCGRCPGITWALLPLQGWRPRGRPRGAVAIVALRHCHYCSAGVIADVALGPLGHHRPCGAGILADIALALLPLLPSQRWRHCGAGIIVDVTLAPLGHCCHCGTGIIIDVALALLPTLPLRRWHHRGRCDGAIANVVWAPSLLWRWRCHPCHAGVIAWAILPLQRGRQSPSLGWGLWGPPQPF